MTPLFIVDAISTEEIETMHRQFFRKTVGIGRSINVKEILDNIECLDFPKIIKEVSLKWFKKNP